LIPSITGGLPKRSGHVAIPAGNQSADNLIAVLRDQKGGRGIRNQALDIIKAVRRRCVPTPGLSP
jgi:hypothetical protein